MSYNLFLDDIRYPYSDNKNVEDAYYYTRNPAHKNLKWEIVRNYNEFVSYITKHGIPDLISFDHDLGKEHYEAYFRNHIYDYESFEEKTGLHCVKWLCDYCQKHNIKFPTYIVHSLNSTGAKNIYTYIYNYQKHIEGQV